MQGLIKCGRRVQGGQYGAVLIKQIFSYTFYSDVKNAILIKTRAAKERLENPVNF